MKTNFLLLLLIFGLNVHSQIYFPDANLKQAIINYGLDLNSNNEIEYLEAFNATQLDISNSNITDLTGLDNFYSLSYLNISNNPGITGFNLTNHPSLDHFLCSNCDLSTLDVSSLSMLHVLNCSGNKLVSIDISSNSDLFELNCSGNLLTSLDVSHNALYLVTLNCTGNSNLLSICVADVNVAQSNQVSYLKDLVAQWTSNCTTGLKQIQDNAISLYPNPSKDFIVLSGGYLNIAVFDFLGEKVLQTYQNTIDVKNLSEGIYFVKAVANNGQLITKSFVKE
jgi:hypothetical protein